VSIGSEIGSRFERQYGAAPEVIVSAPGRVNLIGEHTDYNDGFVLPMALDLRIWAAYRRIDGDACSLFSVNQDGSVEFDLSRIEPQRDWGDFPRGVAARLLEDGDKISGFQGLIWGDVPVGAGLSSSAAIEVALLYGLQTLFNLPIDPVRDALRCQAVENQFVGMNCGIMDPFSSRLCREGHALFLDCRDLSIEQIPLDGAKYRVLIVDSMVRRSLLDSEYNQVRQECLDGAAVLAQKTDSGSALRDFTLDDLEEHRRHLSDSIYLRCRHVISENERVLTSIEAMKNGDIPHFGELMYQSHQSLRDDFRVSCPELDGLVEIASGIDGIYGARLTGAGFGGAVVALVQAGTAETARLEVVRDYKDRFGTDADAWLVRPDDGARVESG
jgi:galactokinase